MPKRNRRNHNRIQNRNSNIPSTQAVANTSSATSSAPQATSSTTSLHISATSIFHLFQPGQHTVNWYVHRPSHVRKELKRLWDNGPKISDDESKRQSKRDLINMNLEQEISTKVNALFRALEQEGPNPSQYQVKPDRKHGRCNRPQDNCISKGFNHCHVSDKKHSYVVMWQAFEGQQVIHIVSIGYHENFNFSSKNHDSLAAMNTSIAAAKKANFHPEKPFDPKKYDNSIKASR